MRPADHVAGLPRLPMRLFRNPCPLLVFAEDLTVSGIYDVPGSAGEKRQGAEVPRSNNGKAPALLHKKGGKREAKVGVNASKQKHKRS